MPGLRISWAFHEAGDRDRLPVILLHGFMGNSHVWERTIEQLSDIAYFIAPDLPGHGNSEGKLDELSFDSLAEALVAFSEEHVDRPPILGGYSLGGRVALYTALTYPDTFSGLILESCTPGISDKKERSERLEHDKNVAQRLRSQDMEAFLKNWYTQPVFNSLSADQKDGIIKRKAANNPAYLAEVVVRLSQGVQPSLWNRISKWRKPTMIIAGERDGKYVGIATRMSMRMPKSYLDVVPHSGHIVHLENNEAFVRGLKFFLTSYML